MDTITECCQPISTEPLSRSGAEQLAGWYKVLSDPTRLRLLSLITSRGEACAACDLVDDLGVSQPTVSYHLKALHQAGLIRRHKRGRWIYYQPCPDKLSILSNNLNPNPLVNRG